MKTLNPWGGPGDPSTPQQNSNYHHEPDAKPRYDARELWSVPAVSSYLGIAFSLWSLIENRLILAVIFLALLSAILAAYLIVVHRKYRDCKPYKKIDKHLHKLSHHVNEFMAKLKQPSEGDMQDAAAIASKNVLTDASNIFTMLIGHECTASLMLPETVKPGQEQILQTVQYCHNASPDRERHRGTGIAIGKGVPGYAFTSGEVITWRDTDKNFVPSRSDHRKYYVSGMCIPLRWGFEYLGLVNIDCRAENGFSDEMHKELGAVIGNHMSFIQVTTLLLRKTSGADVERNVTAVS